jgi:hypothetical protein
MLAEEVNIDRILGMIENLRAVSSDPLDPILVEFERRYRKTGEYSGEK